VNIAAALFTGLVFGALELDTNDQTALSFEVNSKLVEVGNNLVSSHFRGAMRSARSAQAICPFLILHLVRMCRRSFSLRGYRATLVLCCGTAGPS